jgi:hypothetical protein
MAMNETILSRRFDSQEFWLAAAVFALVVVIGFPQVGFLKRSLVPTDNYNPLEPEFTQANYGPGFVPSSEWSSRGIIWCPNYHDPGGSSWQGEPALLFFHNALFSRQFPFWDPSVACGAPAYCNPTNEFLFPPQIVLCLAGATSLAKNIYILVLFWAAGFATYCLLRLHMISPIASAAGGLAFLFSGAVQQVAPSIFMGQPVVMMPVILIAVRLLLNSPSYRRTSLTAAVFATAGLASFPPILVAAFMFAIFYFLCALMLERGALQIRLSRFIIAGALALGLVAIYYIPIFVAIAHTEYATSWYRTAALDTLPVVSLFDLLSPTAIGGPLVYAAPIMNFSAVGHLFYVGTATLLLASLSAGILPVPQRSLLLACLIGGGLVILKLLGVPPVQWAARLPVLQSIHYAQYFGILLAFILALLAAIGFDRLLRRSVKWSLLAGTLIVMVALGALWIIARKSGGFQEPDAWRWIADYRLLLVFAIAAIVASAVVLLTDHCRRAFWVAASLMLALIAIEGIVNATYPRQKRWDVFAHPPRYVGVLQRLPRPFRVFVGAALSANLASAFGVDEFDSLYSFSPPRVFEIYDRYAHPGAVVSMRVATVLPPDLVLDRAGIDYVLVRQNLPVIFKPALRRSYHVAYEDGYVRLFRRGPVARYFFSSEYRLTDQASALKAISTAPAKEIILESPPPVAASPNMPADPIPEVMSVKLNSLYLRLQSPRPGLLYIADSYYDGWSAKVNGRPSQIYIANYGFRAVAVPAGNVEVRLSYLPVGFTTGASVSVASLVIALFLVTTTRRRSLPKDAGSIA